MMIPQLDYHIAEQRLQEYRRIADQARMVQEARGMEAPSRTAALVGRALTAIGSSMLRAGARLGGCRPEPCPEGSL